MCILLSDLITMLTAIPEAVLDYDILPLLSCRDLMALTQVNKALHTVITNSSTYWRVRNMAWNVNIIDSRLIHNIQNIQRNSPECWQYICLLHTHVQSKAHALACISGLISPVFLENNAMQIWTCNYTTIRFHYYTCIIGNTCLVFSYPDSMYGEGRSTLIYGFDLPSPLRHTISYICDPLFWDVVVDRQKQSPLPWKRTYDFNIKLSYAPRSYLAKAFGVNVKVNNDSETQCPTNKQLWLETVEMM